MSKRYLKGPSPVNEIKDLLTSLLVTEMLSPGKRIWLSSPWISDVFLLDNSYREYQGLIPDQPSNWPLSRILAHCATRDTIVRIMTRKPNAGRPGTDQFLKNLKSLEPSIEVKFDEELHEKGFLTETFYLEGSMNFTYNGLNINREAVTLETSPKEIARQHVEYEGYWKST
jgi:PLD-like domain